MSNNKNSATTSSNSSKITNDYSLQEEAQCVESITLSFSNNLNNNFTLVVLVLFELF
jgi:hypothetical protein